MIQTKIQRKRLLTPLRYPGGKTSLFIFFNEVITAHGWENVVYVEPYAGGAGAAISLLLLGKVKSIIINDYDLAIYAFWKSILDETDRFIEKITLTPITVEEWEKQKIIYSSRNENNLFSLGFAAFYLNRTNRSGILTAGPVGGKNQSGKWKIDARYNKQNLITKIRLIAAHKQQITVVNNDGIEVIELYSKDPNTFFYIDPPYYKKGAELYLNSFSHSKHQCLAETLYEHADKKWILSYDNNDQIKGMYQAYGFEPEIFSLGYSAHAQSRVGSEIMIFSDAVNKEALS